MRNAVVVVAVVDDLEPSASCLDEPAGDEQAEAHAANALAHVGVEAEERLEYLLARVRGDLHTTS